MRFKLLFLASALLTALVFSAPPPAFRNQLDVLQKYAKNIYPDSEDMQKKAVVTLRYLFRNREWNNAWYWHRIDDFLRTGGLKSASNRAEVTILDAAGHLQQYQVIEDVAYSRPSLDKIIKNNKKDVQKHNRLKDHEILAEPPWLGRYPDTHVQPEKKDLFRGIPRPLTQQDLEAELGDSWQRASRSNQDGRGKRITDLGFGK
ncbi:conserved hypothetical Ustilaginaceae_specific protein [Sporisorium reilianum SRZ2]|uniref:Conserved hypothetical Ustilaginaceae_specific protein n=1 Tax=Sporisorium reilianum (strain SRZ2) TaxID=999809 RepID=E7A185_SPORE|nr:conserved hypothetical Ustilaginaceae_specific protein [Sporisorium reilianum SRZ2]